MSVSCRLVDLPSFLGQWIVLLWNFIVSLSQGLFILLLTFIPSVMPTINTSPFKSVMLPWWVCSHPSLCPPPGRAPAQHQFVGASTSMGYPGGSVVRNSPASARDAGDTGLISGSRRSPGVGNDNPLQYSCLQNPFTGEPGGLSPWGPKELNMT